MSQPKLGMTCWSTLKKINIFFRPIEMLLHASGRRGMGEGDYGPALLLGSIHTVLRIFLPVQASQMDNFLLLVKHEL